MGEDQSWDERQKYQIYHFQINHIHSFIIDDCIVPNCYAIKKSWKVKKWIINNNKGKVAQREEEQNKYKTETKTMIK